jgi:hypothetical protein
VFFLRALLDFGASLGAVGFKFGKSLLFAFRSQLFFNLRFEVRLLPRFQARVNFANPL